MLNHPRLFEILAQATAWSSDPDDRETWPKEKSYWIGHPAVGRGMIGIRPCASEFRDELVRILTDLEILTKGSSGQGLAEIWELIGEGEKFLRLWALAEELGIFPQANNQILLSMHEAIVSKNA